MAFSTFSVMQLQMSSLLAPLIQLVKTGFTKAVQRLDGIYALLLVGKIAAVDIKAGANYHFFSVFFILFMFGLLIYTQDIHYLSLYILMFTLVRVLKLIYSPFVLFAQRILL